jgi:excisionase family DNA binding protein
MLSITEASRVVGISRAGMYKLVKSSTTGLPVVHIGTRLLVPRDQLFEWIDKQIKH